MKAIILKLAESDELSQEMIDSSFSFEPFIEYLEQRIKDEHSVKSKFYGFVLERLHEASNKEKNIANENIPKYRDELELIYLSLTQLIDDEKGKLWGLGLPVVSVLFYGTDSMYNIMFNKTEQTKINKSYRKRFDAGSTDQV